MQTPATVSQTTLDFWNQLGPWRDADAAPDNPHRYLLLTLCDALGSAHDTTERYTRDDAAHTGWGQLLDVNACPSAALPWLAQFAGVKIPVGTSDANSRTMITSQTNTKRGTVAVMRAAAQPLLTGTQRVDIIERTPDAYSFEIITYATETPNGAAVQAALQAVKPAGLIMSYLVQSGNQWQQMAANTWAGMGAATWASESITLPP